MPQHNQDLTFQVPEVPAGTPEEVQAAGALAFAGQPALAWEILTDFKKRAAGVTVLKALKEAGFPLDDPSGVVLSSLLASRAVTVDEAFSVYMQIKEIQAANLQIALRMRQIEEASWNARRAQAQAFRAEVQSIQDLADTIYGDTVEGIDNELEAVNRQIRELSTLNAQEQMALKSQGIDPRKELQRLEDRKKALLGVRTMITRKKERFVFHLTNKLRTGQPAALSAPEAIVQEKKRELDMLTLAQKGDEAFKDSELEVDEYFIAWSGINSQIDVGGKRRTDIPTVEEVNRAKSIYKEFIDVLSTYLGPGYTTYFARAYEAENGPLLFAHTVDNQNTEQESSFWNAYTKGGALATAGAGFMLFRKRIVGVFRRLFGKKPPIPPPQGKPGPVQDIVNQAKQRAESVVSPPPPKSGSKRRKK